MKKNAIILMTSMFMVLLFQSPVWANVGAMEEGAALYHYSILFIVLAVFVIDPLAYRNIWSWISAILLFLYLYRFVGPFSPVLILFPLIYFIYKSVRLIISQHHIIGKIVRLLVVVIVLAIFTFSIYFGNASRGAYFYRRSHQNLLDIMDNTAKKVITYREKNYYLPTKKEFYESIYTEPESFVSTFYKSIAEREKANLEYIPYPDGHNFTIIYRGNYFTNDPWYLLPRDYPQYYSGNGLRPGKRIPFINAYLMKQK